jgi:hypothetical protein
MYAPYPVNAYGLHYAAGKQEAAGDIEKSAEEDASLPVGFDAYLHAPEGPLSVGKHPSDSTIRLAGTYAFLSAQCKIHTAPPPPRRALPITMYRLVRPFLCAIRSSASDHHRIAAGAGCEFVPHV